MLIIEAKIILWLNNYALMKKIQFFLHYSFAFFQKTFSPYMILYWVRMVLFVVMLVDGVVSTKVVMALTTLAEALATLWREWAPKIGLIHPMDH